MPSVELKHPASLSLAEVGWRRRRAIASLSGVDAWKLATALAVLGAAAVGYLAAENPHAAPSGLAVGGRVLIILLVAGAGVCAHRSPARASIGRWLILASVFACLWLLNGSAAPLAFTVGAGAGMLAPLLACYLLLAHPRGRLRNRWEARLLAIGGAVLVLAWTAALLTSSRPPLAPLLRCGAHCPRNLLYTGVGSDGALRAVLLTTIMLAALAMSLATFGILLQRFRRAHGPVRRVTAPVMFAAAWSAAFLLCFCLAAAARSSSAEVFGFAYVATALAIPVAILAGLQLERLFLGSALAAFLQRLGDTPPASVEKLLADTLEDPRLAIAVREEGSRELIGLDGASLDLLARDQGRALVDFELDGRRSAGVIFDADLEDQRPFVEAAGKAALMSLDRARLDAELLASTDELRRSRRRLLHAAVSERERIQRDLHDSAQQRLIAARMKARLARQLAHEHPTRAAELIADVDEELDGMLEELRALANGVFPPVLSDHGLRGALRVACDRASLPATLELADVGRYSRDVESAVYFTCLESIQNAEKHAGPDARISVSAWERDGWLRFSVADSGSGFGRAPETRHGGLLNMRDRIEALGGSLSISSEPGAGTVVSGTVPPTAPMQASSSDAGRRTAGAV